MPYIKQFTVKRREDVVMRNTFSTDSDSDSRIATSPSSGAVVLYEPQVKFRDMGALSPTITYVSTSSTARPRSHSDMITEDAPPAHVDTPKALPVAAPPGFTNLQQTQLEENQRRLDRALMSQESIRASQITPTVDALSEASFSVSSRGSSSPAWESRFAGFLSGIDDSSDFDKMTAKDKIDFKAWFDAEHA